MKDKFPREGESYLSVKRKIEVHANVMRQRATDLMSSAKTEMAK